MVAYLLRASGDNWNLPLYVAAAGYFAAMALLDLASIPVTPIVKRQAEGQGAALAT